MRRMERSSLFVMELVSFGGALLFCLIVYLASRGAMQTHFTGVTLQMWSRAYGSALEGGPLLQRLFGH